MLGGRGGPFFSIVVVVPRRRWQLRACSAFDYPAQQLLYYATIARATGCLESGAARSESSVLSETLESLVRSHGWRGARALQCVD